VFVLYAAGGIIMLITFSCKASGNVTMFGDIATQLIKMMGYCDNVPGAIDAKDVPTALDNLEQTIQAIKQQQIEAQKAGTLEEKNEDELDDADYEPEISISMRAMPLIDFLKAAVKGQCHVMWQ
jgi:uncharacterized protein DUF1840